MDVTSSISTTDHRQLARSLLAVQGAMFFVVAIEAALMAAAIGNSAGIVPALASICFGLGLFYARRRLEQGQGRRLLKWLEGLVLAWSLINLLLALFLTGTGTGLVVAVTGFALPLAILGLVMRGRA